MKSASRTRRLRMIWGLGAWVAMGACGSDTSTSAASAAVSEDIQHFCVRNCGTPNIVELFVGMVRHQVRHDTSKLLPPDAKTPRSVLSARAPGRGTLARRCREEDRRAGHLHELLKAALPS